MGYDIRSFGVGGPVKENLVDRGDRGQVGTDVGRLSKALIADSMMCGDPNNKISSNCNDVMLYTERLTAKYIGSIVSNSNGNKQLSHFSNVPVYLDQYADCAGLVISLISDMAVSAKFLDDDGRKLLTNYLKELQSMVSKFNSKANKMHIISSLDILDKNDNEGSPSKSTMDNGNTGIVQFEQSDLLQNDGGYNSIGLIAKMLIVEAMIRKTPQSINLNESLYNISQQVRSHTIEKTFSNIGSIITTFDGKDYNSYFENVPIQLDTLADTVGLIISTIVDAVIAAKFLNETDVKTINADLKNILKMVWVFNSMINGLISNETKSNNSQTPQKK